MNDLERLARAIATGLGDDFDHAFASKAEWIAARGEKGGRYRDINEPRQPDYLSAAESALQELRNPSEGMVEAAEDRARPDYDPSYTEVFRVMIDHILAQEKV